MRRLVPWLLGLAACGGYETAVEPVPANDTGLFDAPSVCESVGTPSEEELAAALVDAAELDAADLVAAHAVSFASALPYAPGEAANLDLIQASSLALDDSELARLEAMGFAIGRGVAFPTFVYAYATIYVEDLPVYVSADSILFAMHRSYDSILESLERRVLMVELDGLLTALRAALTAEALPGEVASDLDLYLAVAKSLLDEELAAPIAGADPGDVASLFEKAMAASGAGSVELFGRPRTVDFSQFAPRGHYAGDSNLERYFRAMIWLGRIDFRMTGAPAPGEVGVDRRQVAAALGLHALFEPTTAAAYDRIDGTIRGFVGEADMMTLADVEQLMDDLEVATVADLDGVDDATLLETLVEGGYGQQRIASHILEGDTSSPESMPRSFALLPQRYVVDSYVFSNVVYDRVPSLDGKRRYMPDPLDVAFAALGNEYAASLLEPQLETFGYAPQLSATRTLVDAHGCDYWEASLYGQWLQASRALSKEASDPALPVVARTEPWTRRLLNTQLASWAELRHDTLLYAKQSYSGGETCVFPDAYVDPYPGFYAAVRAYAERGRAIVDALTPPGGPEGTLQRIDQHFAKLAEVASKLEEIAVVQRAGEPLTADHIAFINDMVVPGGICGGPGVSGWYVQLFIDQAASVEFDPTIADVHTQPFEDEAEVGKVLHVATGRARPMVVTIDGCDGPRAFVGPVSSYYELTTSDYQRLTDQEWSTRFDGDLPPAPWWLSDLVGE